MNENENFFEEVERILAGEEPSVVVDASNDVSNITDKL
jgi:hypothetical protein